MSGSRDDAAGTATPRPTSELTTSGAALSEVASSVLASSGMVATKVRFRVMLWLVIAAALSYLVRGAVSVSESTIREELGLSLADSGWFMGAFFWSYALFQVPSAAWSQRFGTRATLACFAIAWSLATLMLGLAGGFAVLIAAQLLMGIAQAGVFPASCNSIARWMPLSRRSLACAALSIGMQLGAIAASIITARLLHPVGWRWLFVLYSLPGFLWAVWFYWRFRDDPRDDAHVNAQERAVILIGSDQSPSDQSPSDQSPSDQSPSDQSPSDQSPSRQSRGDHRRAVRTPWRAIVLHVPLWYLCGQQICRAAGYMFFASWFPTFLQRTRHVSVSESGYLQALVFLGTLVGSLLGGILTDAIFRRTGSIRLSRSGVGAGALAACSGLILAAWFVENATLAVALLAIGAMAAALAGPCAFSATIDTGGGYVPQVFGVMNMAGNLAAAACPIVVARLFAWTANWDLVLLVFAGVYLLGAGFWLLVDPSKKLAAS